MYTIEMTNDTSPASWFFNLYLHSQTETDTNLLSDLKIVILLKRSASNSVLNIPTHVMTIEILKVCNHDQPLTTKTLTFSNQSEVPIE